MTRLQRFRHSLSGRTFFTMILFSLVVSIAAISFGYYLYASSVLRDYRNRSWQMSRTANQFIDKEEALDEAAEVLEIYFQMTEEERDQLHDKNSPLLSRFDSVRDEGFEELRAMMRDIQETNGGKAAFTAVIDPATNRRIFIADSDPNDTFCPPGSWDEYSPEIIRDLTEGREYFLDKYFGVGKIPATTFKMEPYGFRCMAGTVIGNVDNYQIFVICDTDMNSAAAVVTRFLWLYIALLVLIIVITLIIVMRHINRNMVRPINQLSEAAEAYTKDRDDENRDSLHFGNLEIQTGDEIEKLSNNLKEMEQDLGYYIYNMTRISAERERISTELSLATRIQADMLPNIFPAFPDRPEFDVYAEMNPAKEVGGDFYDFFLVDDNHLCLVMADVSGKGVPAALFMMISKILIKNAAMLGLSPAQVLEKVNHQICANNREEMFVTVWLGILEISTGKLTASNAGHECPMITGPDGSFILYKDPHGFVLGGFDGIKYKEYELHLDEGSKLFVYTDGVKEAANPKNQMFGTDRMLNTLNNNKSSSPKELLNCMRIDVDKFSDGAEQFDDLTMLCIEYFGPKGN